MDKKKIAVTFVGDANNVAFSLMEILLKFGHDVRFAGPKEYFWSDEAQEHFKNLADEHGGKVLVTTNPQKAVENTDVIYSDTFISMGEEREKEKKLPIFAKYQVNDELFETANDNAIFLHCLPAYRGIEVTGDVLDGERSRIYELARNRMVVAKGIFAKILSD